LGRIVEDVGEPLDEGGRFLTTEDPHEGTNTMMSASFGREIADSHFQRLLAEAEHDRLIGCLKRERRARAHEARSHSPRRKMTDPCPQDVG